MEKNNSCHQHLPKKQTVQFPNSMQGFNETISLIMLYGLLCCFNNRNSTTSYQWQYKLSVVISLVSIGLKSTEKIFTTPFNPAFFSNFQL